MTRSRATSALAAAAAPHLLATAVAGADQTPWLPQEPNFPLGPGAGYSAYHPQAAGRHWHTPSHTTRLPDQYPPPQFAHAGDSLAVQTHTLPRANRQLTPTIAVSPDPYTPDSQVQPQDSHCNSATSIYAPWRNNLGDLDGVFGDSNYTLPVTRRPVQTPHGRNMADVIPPQMAPGGNGLASPASDHLPPTSRQMTPSHVPMGDNSVRKRSFDEMSQGPQQMQMHTGDHQSPHESPYGNSPGNVDDSQGHKVQRMIKRGEPPQAHDGKYYCDFAQECNGLYFDRKCEWSKHMDKHDRPYRCQQPQCAKLQGFTYSGGLLRHEREVHNKHGGPKDALRCNVAHCKRFNGKGFTRKENLNEHLRRVHGITSDAPANPTNPSSLRQIAADAAPGVDMIETPASRFSETGEIDELNTSTPYPDINKRRRLDNGASPRSNDDLEQELQRLKADNLEKDERIRRMEANDSAREARMKSLEDTLSQLTAQGLQRVPDQAPMTSHMGTNMHMGNIDHTLDSNIDQSLGNTMGGAIGSYPEFNGNVVEKHD